MRTTRPEPRLGWVLACPGGEIRRDEASSFAAAVDVALRAGHGVGARFDLDFTSGVEGEVSLSTEDPRTARWIGRVLQPAFRPARWTSCARPSGALEGARGWYGRRVVTGSTPWWPDREHRPWGDVLVPALRALPPGVHLTWSIAAQAIERSWLADLLTGPPPGARRMAEGPRRSRIGFDPPYPDPAYHDRPLRWQVRACARIARESPAGSQPSRVTGALDSALAGEQGGGFRFGGAWSLLGRAPASFPVVHGEVVALFPSLATSLVAASSPGADALPELPIGRTDSGEVVSVPVDAGQGRHLAVLGESGMGKSSLLVALALRASRWGTVVLMDPLGETARALDAELAPGMASRVRRVYAERSTAAMNALEGIGSVEGDDGLRTERRLNDLVHALRRVRSGRYADSGFWGPRLEEMLTRSLRAAATIPGATLADAHTLLATGGRTFRDLAPETLGPIRDLAARIRERPEDAEGARRLLFEVVGSRLLERLLCAREPTLRPSELLAPHGITLVSGDADRVGESSARYLLSVYLALVWSELIGRSARTKTFVVLDEVQWYAHESLAEMLRLGRKRNVHVVLATQAISTLPEEVRDAVWTNVADFVAFRGSPDEAREFARVARGVSTESLLALPRGRAVALLGKGNAARWIRTARIPGGPRKGPWDIPPAEPPAGVRGSEGVDPSPTHRIAGLEPSNGPREQAVLEHLRSLARSAAAAPTIRVYLDELRRQSDPEGSGVRAVGRRLVALGAIDRGERDAHGAYWSIRVERLLGSDAPEAAEPTGDVTHPEKPS